MTLRTNPLVIGSTASFLGGSVGALLVAVSGAPASAATTYTVDTLGDGPATASDCTTPVAGSCSLRDALAAATGGGDTIVFDPSITGTISLNQGELQITSAVTITGPGSGALTIDAGGTSRAINIMNSTADTSISGVTITNGNAGSANGGAIYAAQNADISLDDVVLSGNVAGYGGAIKAGGGTFLIADSTITGNTASGDGGALWLYKGDLTITNSTIESNTSGNRGGGLWIGGGVTSNHGTVTIVESTIKGNTATSLGGGLNLYLVDLTVTNSTFDSNDANRGGGFFSKPTLSNFAPAHAITITGSTFSDNTAALYGGGFFLYHGDGNATVLIGNSTFTGNAATGTINATDASSAAMDLGYGNSVTLTQSTIVGNTSAGTRTDVGAITMDPTTLLTISGTNLSGNTGGAGTADLTLYNAPSATVTIDDSLIGEINPKITVTGSGNIVSTSPGVDALADNGGPTRTMALLSTSAAVDTGPSTVMTFPGSSYDQRGIGFPRIVGTRSDIGAFEIQPPPDPTPTTSTEEPIVPAFTG